MSNINTGIEWTDRTWNPVTGCTKISSGCAHCYAEAITKRFPNSFPDGFKIVQHPDRLNAPRRWRKPSRIFVNSMSDLFHAEVDLDFVEQVFDVIRETPQHTYQVLTKRAALMLEASKHLEWPENLWAGVSVESQGYVRRVDYLRRVPAAVRFLSCEPLLGALDLDLTDIHWVITGGESGHKHRWIDPDWVRGIRDRCIETQTPFFFKQWGGITPKKNGRELDGRTWEQFPRGESC